MKRDILGIALCGGKSSRMGEDKAALEVRPGKSQLAYALELLSSVCDEVAVCAGRQGIHSEGVPVRQRVLRDVDFASGPMAGLIAGLQAAAGRAVLTVACDMPYLEASLLVQLVNRRDPEKAATAFVAEDGQPEPMCAIYEPSSLRLLEERARAGRESLRGFLSEFPVELIPLARPDLLASVNDQAELERARHRLS